MTILTNYTLTNNYYQILNPKKRVFSNTITITFPAQPTNEHYVIKSMNNCKIIIKIIIK